MGHGKIGSYQNETWKKKKIYAVIDLFHPKSFISLMSAKNKKSAFVTLLSTEFLRIRAVSPQMRRMFIHLTAATRTALTVTVAVHVPAQPLLRPVSLACTDAVGPSRHDELRIVRSVLFDIWNKTVDSIKCR